MGNKKKKRKSKEQSDEHPFICDEHNKTVIEKGQSHEVKLKDMDKKYRPTSHKQKGESSKIQTVSSKRKRKISSCSEISDSPLKRKGAKRKDVVEKSTASSSSEPRVKIKAKRRKKKAKKEIENVNTKSYSHLTKEEKDIVVNYKASPKKAPQDTKIGPKRPSKSIKTPKCQNTPTCASSSRTRHSTNLDHSDNSVIFLKESFVKKPSGTQHPSPFSSSTPFPSSKSRCFSNFPNITPIASPVSGPKPAITGKIFSNYESNSNNNSVFGGQDGKIGSFISGSNKNESSANICASLQNWFGQGQGTSKNDSLEDVTLINADQSVDDSVILIDSSQDSNPTVIEILDSEMEDMEVDDDEMIQSLQSVREQMTNFDPKDAGSLSETITNTTVFEVALPIKQKQIIFVLDTNILLHSLRFFNNLLNMEITGHGNPLVVIPWMVILELDHLKVERHGRNKMDPSVSFMARSAARLLEKLMVDHHPKLKFQKPTEVNEKLDIPIHSNDDRILHCCLQWKKKNEDSRVVLVSRDRNLRTKALITELESASNADLWETLNLPVPSVMANDTVKFVPASPTAKKSEMIALQRQRPPLMKSAPIHSLIRRDQRPPPRQAVHIQQPKPAVSMRLDALDDKDVFNKFSAIWNLLLALRSNLNNGASIPKIHVHNFINKMDMLRGCIDNCLSISPVLLGSAQALQCFSLLSNTLNYFYQQTEAPIIDPTQNVGPHPLMHYFGNIDNRLRLSQAMNELIDIGKSIMDYVQG